MIYVLVWKPRPREGRAGHAALDVGGREYISWWPKSDNPLEKIFSPVHPAPPCLARDREEEGDRKADHRIRLVGLDEKAILRWWARIYPWAEGRSGPPSIPWRLTGWNCAKVVATALKVGGGDRYAGPDRPEPHTWKPLIVKIYAEMIRRGLEANR